MSTEELIFHRTGARSSLASADSLRPALFARFHDLRRLRYDFPLVLAPDGAVRSLSACVDELLREVAPRGLPGERLRRGVLRLEREIRSRLAAGETGTLSSLWERAGLSCIARAGDELARDLVRARAALRIDGEVVDCDAALPGRVVEHLWSAARDRKRARMRADIDALVVRLTDLVRADLARSEAGRHPDALAAGVGAPHRELFDFVHMSALLAKPSGASALSDTRRLRIERALAVLRSQRFFDGAGGYGYLFDRFDDALAAFRERLAAMASLVRAMAIAELEVRGEYVQAVHDPYFAGFDERALRPEVVAMFPDPLVRLDVLADDIAERSRLIEALTSGAPLKALLVTDDPFGVGAQLATTAMGLGDVFIVQAAASGLGRVAPAIRAAMEYAGPALISVCSGAIAGSGLPPYLVAAAAADSRAFPTFSYDPSAGADWKHRFTLHDNAQPERTWPVHDLDHRGPALRRLRVRVPFTVADLALCDPRRTGDLARVPREQWGDGLVSVDEWLERDGGAQGDAVPCVYAIDAAGSLERVVVGDGTIRATRRAAEAWRRLRELDDLKREREPAPPAVRGDSARIAEAAPAPMTAATPAAPAPDDPSIETPRCATCNECTNLNPRMFAYNDDKQAYIKDVTAGTYRDLVLAAEACQVAIIHPGKPRDPNEPGLDELVARAAPFL